MAPQSMRKYMLLHAVSILLMIFASACRMNDTGQNQKTFQPKEGSTTEELIMISGHAGTFKDRILRIGTGGYKWQEYTDRHGTTRKGWVAGLSLWTMDDSIPRQNFVIHEGQEILYGKYRVKVIQIDKKHWFTFWTIKDEFARLVIDTSEKSQ
jgi:hypothetical protein